MQLSEMHGARRVNMIVSYSRGATVDIPARQLTAQKMKFSIKDFFRKCDQIGRKLRIWSHLPKKSLMENFIFCAVTHIPNTNTLLLISSYRPIIQITLNFS